MQPLRSLKDDGAPESKGATGAATTNESMFADADALKAEAHKDLGKREFDIMDYYKTSGIMQCIARSPLFGHGTLLVIMLNSVWIGLEMDLNDAEQLSDAEWYFQFGEYFFFVYFSFELIVRFGALQRKRDGLLDKWFIFDSVLVFLMVLETAMMPLVLAIVKAAKGSGDGEEGGDGDSSMGDLTMLRMFRLLRLTRMVRFMRAVPELVTLLKSMTIALRSVLSTLTLLVLFMYIFAIIFKSQLKTEDEYLERKFGRIPNAMWTLLMHGALLDATTACANTLLDNSPLMTFVFLVFIFLASFTVLNMLIGLLCEVVTAVASAEKEKAIVSYVKTRLLGVLEKLDADKSGTISKDEFEALLAIPEAVQALDELGVDVPNLVSLSEHLFEADEFSRMGIEGVEKGRKSDDEDGSRSPKAKGSSSQGFTDISHQEPDEEEEANVALTFADFLEIVIRLRADNRPSVLDVVDLRKLVLKSQRQVLDKVGGLDKMNLTLSREMEDVTASLGKFCTQHRALLLGLSLESVGASSASEVLSEPPMSGASDARCNDRGPLLPTPARPLEDTTAEDWLTDGIDVSPVQPKASSIDGEVCFMREGDSDSDFKHEHANS